jgi:drug/metabolite transporter (DMT)-like permease
MAAEVRRNRTALIFLVVGALSGGFASILIRLCSYPAPAVASMRMVLAGLALLPFCVGALRRTWRERNLCGFLPLFLPGLFLAAHLQCCVLALQYTSVANATFL